MSNQAVLIFSQIVCALIKMEGMKAANESARMENCYPVYDQAEFEALIDNFGIEHNAVITALKTGV